MKKSFFSKFDWAAFWVATLVSFAVYFYTLGPSVGLEDSGELATASAHLGVPHPPGYPFWTFCTWVFCKIFSFVTYMGHPNPAWAVSCCSAFFGALAAGCTAMLISRSASDFIFNNKSDSLFKDDESSVANWLSFAGGVAGALAFAFSPVEWSQSTIVEIYSLNSLFLMLVFLLSYRWMRRPTDKTLWFTAFVFGLGLTNYQVLLFAIVPLAIIICLKNFRLFREFILFLIPVLLTWQVLKTAEFNRAKFGMASEVVVKHAPVGMSDSEYTVFGSGLLQYYLCGPERLSEIAKEYRDELIRHKADMKKRASADKNNRVMSADYKKCIDIESQLKNISAVQRSLRSLDRDTREKLNRISYANNLVYLDSNPRFRGIDKRDRGVIEAMRALGFDDKDLEVRDGGYHFKSEAWQKLNSIINPQLESRTDCAPNIWVVSLSLAVFFVSLLLVVYFKKRSQIDYAVKAVIAGGVSSAVFLLLSCTVFSTTVIWTGLDAEQFAPPVEPTVYIAVGVFILLSVTFGIVAALKESGSLFKGHSLKAVVASAAFALMAVLAVFKMTPSAEGLPEKFGYHNIEESSYYDEWRGAMEKEISSEPNDNVRQAKREEVTRPTDACPPWAFTVFMLVTLLTLSVFVKKGLCFAIPVAGLQMALFTLLSRGAMHGLAHPSTWWFWWPLVWNFVALFLVWLVLPNGRSVAFAAFFAQLGVSFYAYMPIVSELRNPPMNWGYPRTWEGFKHAITRGQYEAITMPEFSGIGEFIRLVLDKMKYYFTELKMQFTDYLVILALLPLACWRFIINIGKCRRVVFNAFVVSSVVAIILAVRAICVTCGCADFKALAIVDNVLIFIMLALAVVGVLLIAFKQVFLRPVIALCRFQRVIVREKRKPYIIASLILVVTVFIYFTYSLFSGRGGLIPFAVLLGLPFVVAVAWYLVPELIKLRSKKGLLPCEVSFYLPGSSQHWLLASGACFIMMTLPLILLANVKGDVQDGFIQKVKFISSHAMIAMWIGYGLVFLAALFYFVSKRAPLSGVARKSLVGIIVVCMILGVSVTPVVQNYTDDDIVTRFGGSEQNDHTFGWQFGAYQLDGAKAIRAQLTADEEPLPDPDWPPPMEPYSIFFGGTDPGRFVPTYMIYGANFRPDVYLITQNALADDTYMSVQRDLYGDEIWIPSKEDSGKAFSRYLEEVKAGIRKPNGAIREENGRVQVTGALGVMEINGILTQMMHEKDRSRHAFYIEESYAMPWMYPNYDLYNSHPISHGYLSPHGLIMKINADETPYDESLARKDRDFWDWYTKRLLSDPMYRRDFAAQKSFSKLRASIAGLYMKQTRYKEAADAFREAHLLYPLSPEATFRYISEVLLPMQKFDIVADLVAYTDKNDPNNMRTETFKAYLPSWQESMKKLDSLVDTCELKIRKSETGLEDSIYSLAEEYYKTGNVFCAFEEISRIKDYILKCKDSKKLLTASMIYISALRLEEAALMLDTCESSCGTVDARVALNWAMQAHHLSPVYHERAYRYFDLGIARDPTSTEMMIKRYVAKLKPDKQDWRLWTKLAKAQYLAGRRDAAMQSLLISLDINQIGVDLEIQRDPILRKIIEDLRKKAIERRR